jgi:thymidylate synthase
MVAKVTGLKVGEFIHTFGDVHIYSNHMEQVKEQLSREAMEPTAQVVIHGEHKSIDDFKFEDFEVKEYKSHPSIKAPIAV